MGIDLQIIPKLENTLICALILLFAIRQILEP
ncbi:hypothetical protein M2135_001799 [Parabacteroides sp. PF5-9]|nr:hypothetical protein [Parabacteroides sp. PF5-9]